MTEEKILTEKEIKEKQEDLSKRVASFNEGLMPLLKEHRLGLSAEPFIARGLILAKPTLIDDTRPEDEKKEEPKKEEITEG